MSLYKPDVHITKHIAMIKAEMVNTSGRVVRAGQKALEKEAHEIVKLAVRYAPHKDGNLDNPRNWVVDKKQSGANRRNVFTVRLKENTVIGHTKKLGKSIRLRDYARRMESSFYNLGQGSIAKAHGLGVGTQASRGEYVGRLYFSRAINRRRIAVNGNVLKAVQRGLSNQWTH